MPWTSQRSHTGMLVVTDAQGHGLRSLHTEPHLFLPQVTNPVKSFCNWRGGPGYSPETTMTPCCPCFSEAWLEQSTPFWFVSHPGAESSKTITLDSQEKALPFLRTFLMAALCQPRMSCQVQVIFLTPSPVSCHHWGHTVRSGAETRT